MGYAKNVIKLLKHHQAIAFAWLNPLKEQSEVERLREELGLTKIHSDHLQTILTSCESSLEERDSKIRELESKLSQLEDHREELIAKVMNLEDKLADIQCKCNPERKHGETSIMCCNECGLPTENFWTKTQLPKKEEQE